MTILKDFKCVADYREWLAQAESADSDDLFVVTGSLYFISEVRNYLIKQERPKGLFYLTVYSFTQSVGCYLNTKKSLKLSVNRLHLSIASLQILLSLLDG